MKKFTKLMVALAFILVPGLTTLTACSTDKTVGITYDLNGGSFTDTYKSENNISSKNVVKLANVDYYAGFADGLPDERDMTAPEGKVFAGWYTDKECTAENYLRSTNWDSFSKAIKEKKGSSVIYAKWIDEGTKDIIYEIVNNDLSFSNKFCTDNNISSETRIVCFNISTTNTDLSKLPTTASSLTVSNASEEINSDKIWNFECNGHYFDFTNGEYRDDLTNKIASAINFDFDYVNLSGLLNNEENVSYAFLRTNALVSKPVNKITVDITGTSNEIIKTEAGEEITPTLNETTSEALRNIVATYWYGDVEFEIRYDIDYLYIKGILDIVDSEKTWQFTIGTEKTDFTEANWNEKVANVRPDSADNTRAITFSIKTMA